MPEQMLEEYIVAAITVYAGTSIAAITELPLAGISPRLRHQNFTFRVSLLDSIIETEAGLNTMQ